VSKILAEYALHLTRPAGDAEADLMKRLDLYRQGIAFTEENCW
jgi:hypothetical protein